MTAKKPARKNTAAVESAPSKAPAIPPASTEVSWKSLADKINELASVIERAKSLKGPMPLLERCKDEIRQAFDILLIKPSLSRDEDEKFHLMREFFQHYGRILERGAHRPDFVAARFRTIARFIQSASPIAKASELYPVKDRWGERVLIVPPKEPTWIGDPSGIVLDIEVRTGTRLKDGGNPIWFIRLEGDFNKRRDPDAGVSFADYCASRHPDLVDYAPTGSGGKAADEVWSVVMRLKIIGQRLGCEGRKRTVERRLKQISSNLKTLERQNYQIRLDTMDHAYRDKFDSE